MKRDLPEYALEFLLGFDGRIHHYPDGYFVKFEIARVEASALRPHGLRYSFTLHGPGGARLIGFDNAHSVAQGRGPSRRKTAEADHWHRTGDDPGRPYRFVSAEQLVEDFFAEVERVLGERGIALTIIADERTER